MNVALNFTVVAVVGLAAFFDIKERRIPNWVVLLGFCGAVLLALLQGSNQLIIVVVGFFAGILALLVPFALGWLGAGDVKLFAAVGALLGYMALPRVFFYSCIVAGIIALLALAMGYVNEISFKRFWTDCKFFFLAGRSGLPKTMPVKPGAYSVPWGVAIGAGTIMAYYFDPAGKWAGF